MEMIEGCKETSAYVSMEIANFKEILLNFEPENRLEGLSINDQTKNSNYNR